jgi:hypothetical protein
MNDETDLPDLPDWIPDFGCKLRKTGLWFDAVRIAGARGERVACADGRVRRGAGADSA